MAEGIATNPPTEDAFVWFREDAVKAMLQLALNDAVKAHGNKAKAIVWDVRARFTELMRNPAPTSTKG
jgi:hypothetical protein